MASRPEELHGPLVEIEDDFSRLPEDERVWLTNEWVGIASEGRSPRALRHRCADGRRGANRTELVNPVRPGVGTSSWRMLCGRMAKYPAMSFSRSIQM
jgi:hypothetical protein